MSEDAIEVRIIGDTTYTNDTFRFMGEVLNKKVAPNLKRKAQNPSSTIEAFLLDSALTDIQWKEYCKELMENSKGKFDNNNVWQGENADRLTQRLLEDIKSDKDLMITFSLKEKVIDFTSNLIDKKDTENLQIILTRDLSTPGGIQNPDSHMFLFVYPPTEVNGKNVRKREISFPTAQCHVWPAVTLLEDSFITKIFDKSINKYKNSKPEKVSIDNKEFIVRLFKTESLPDNELEKVTKIHGRTLTDKFTQAGLAAVDKLAKRKGEHIDVFSALNNEKYALSYIQACHKGIGSVKNKKITIPPLTN
ncbi:MAG: hypothetical protein ABIJ05_01590 [Patescibacteria group bacterium]